MFYFTFENKKVIFFMYVMYGMESNFAFSLLPKKE